MLYSSITPLHCNVHGVERRPRAPSSSLESSSDTTSYFQCLPATPMNFLMHTHKLACTHLHTNVHVASLGSR
jgi:hypothetical protein